MFWRRRIWEAVGGAIDISFRFALDWDLLLRFQQAGAVIVHVPRFLGIFRVHSEQKTSARIYESGMEEMNLLRQRQWGRAVDLVEVNQAIAPFYWRSVLYHQLYRAGILHY